MVNILLDEFSKQYIIKFIKMSFMIILNLQQELLHTGFLIKRISVNTYFTYLQINRIKFLKEFLRQIKLDEKISTFISHII